MLEILNEDVDVYLKVTLGFRYRGFWNGRPSDKNPTRKDGKPNLVERTPPEEKFRIIDLLVSRIQRSFRVEQSYKGIVLIFAPQFKQVYGKYAGTLISQFGFTSDGLMTDFVSYLFEKIVTDFKRKGKKGFIANFNQYAKSKLNSYALCLISAEKNRRGYESGKVRKKKRSVTCPVCERTFKAKEISKTCNCGHTLEIYEVVNIRDDFIETGFNIIFGVESRDAMVHHEIAVKLKLAEEVIHSMYGEIDDHEMLSLQEVILANRPISETGKLYKVSQQRIRRLVKEFKDRYTEYTKHLSKEGKI